MSLLDEDIAKTRKLLNCSNSKSKRSFYASMLHELLQLHDTINYEDNNPHISQELYDLINTSYHADDLLKFHEHSLAPLSQYTFRLTKNTNKSFKGEYFDYTYLNKKYSLKQAKEIALAFYNDFDPKLYNMVKENVDSDHLFIVPGDFFSSTCDGACSFNYATGNSYITMYNSGNFSIEAIDCLVHELGHTIQGKINYSKLILSNNIALNTFGEVLSSIFETIFIDYLIASKQDAKDAYYMDINNLLLLRNAAFEARRVNKHILYLTANNKPLDEEFSSKVFEYQYLYGRLLANYYAEQYKIDPEKARFNIYNFIKSISTRDILSMLSNYGIDKEELAQCQYLKRRIKNDKKALV